MASDSLAEEIKATMGDLSAAERKVARALLAHFPMAGLEPTGALAERAGVSAPTVVRYVTRLGFDGYRSFQRALREELQARRAGPLTLPARYDADTPAGRILRDAPEMHRAAMDETFAALPDSEVEAVIALLADASRPVTTLGGRLSYLFAEYLELQLHRIRPHTRMLRMGRDNALALVDLGKRDVVVAFDLRRYDRPVVEFVRRAHDSGSTVVLFTDPWLSPASAHADHVLPVRVDVRATLDTAAPVLALIETLLGGVLPRLGKAAEDRMRRYDETIADDIAE